MGPDTSWKTGSFLGTTTFRLTGWFLAVFGVLSVLLFVVVYATLSAHLADLTDQELDDTLTEFAALYRERGLPAIQGEFKREAASQGTSRVFFALLAGDGATRAASDLSGWPGIDIGKLARSAPARYRTVSLRGHSHNVRIAVSRLSGGERIVIGQSLRNEDLVLRRYRVTFAIAFVCLLVAGGLVGYLLARKAMAGVTRVTETASRIGPEHLGRRVSLTGEGRELDALSRAFNAMLDRIESLLGELRQMSDNVAHELRTPITRIRGLAETALAAPAGTETSRKTHADIIEACDELTGMIATMLEIAAADSGLRGIDEAGVDLNALLAEAMDLFSPVAEERRIRLHLEVPGERLAILGDRSRLQRAVANILDNAIKYTPDHGEVTLVLSKRPNGTVISVRDTGIGIPKNDLPRIFDRFFRCDRSRSTQGSGLGLALARSIIHAHGGTIEVESSPRGSSFTISLPPA